MREETLQRLCRGYLLRLRPLAAKFGLGEVVDGLVKANTERRCRGTEEEVALLSRACDDERVERQDVPKLLGKSYRQTLEDGDFARIRKLRRTGVYSKIGAVLLGDELRKLYE